MMLYLAQLFLVLGLTTYRIDATSRKDRDFHLAGTSRKFPRTAIDESVNYDNVDSFGSDTLLLKPTSDIIQHIWEGTRSNQGKSKQTDDRKSHFSKTQNHYVYWGVASAINPKDQDLASAFLKSAEAYNFNKDQFAEDVADLLNTMEIVNCETIAIALLRFDILDRSFRALYCGEFTHVRFPRWYKGFSETFRRPYSGNSLTQPILKHFSQKLGELHPGQIIITSTVLKVIVAQEFPFIINKIEEDQELVDIHSRNKKLAETVGTILEKDNKQEDITVIVHTVMPRGFDEHRHTNEYYIDSVDTSHSILINPTYDLNHYIWEGVKQTGDRKSHFSKRQAQYVYWGVASAINPKDQDLAVAFLKSAEAYNFNKQVFAQDVAKLLNTMENVNCETIAIALLRFNIIDGSFSGLNCRKSNLIGLPRWQQGFFEKEPHLICYYNYQKWPILAPFKHRTGNLKPGQIIITSTDLGLISRQKFPYMIESIENNKILLDIQSQNKELAEKIGTYLKNCGQKDITVMVHTVIARKVNQQHHLANHVSGVGERRTESSHGRNKDFTPKVWIQEHNFMGLAQENKQREEINIWELRDENGQREEIDFWELAKQKDPTRQKVDVQ